MTGGYEPTTEPLRPWAGESYYGRPQLKPAPFEPWVVGGYIFLAGLSGSSALIGALAETAVARRSKRAAPAPIPLVRRSRYLALLAPTIGSALLVYDLHTPKRFYNMLRIAKAKSPMSIGTWILMSFSACAGASGLAQFIGDLKPRWRWPHRVARAAHIPAAVAGAGLSTYTASLLSATSTPIWAAAPRALAARFASSSIATGTAALTVSETSPKTRDVLSKLLLAALTTELVASAAADARYRQTGIDHGRSGRWGKIEQVGATGLGVMLPIGLLVTSRFMSKRPGVLETAAGVLTLAGSALMRTSMLGVGIESASRPEVSLRFAQPDNLPNI